MNGLTLGKVFAVAGKILLALCVIFFLGLHSLSFFSYTFTGENQIYSYLGFALTGGGVLVYLAIFKWNSDSVLEKFVSISMMAVCLIGELATAGFGMRLQGFKDAGISFTTESINQMVLAVQILGGLHGLALVLALAGDDVINAFSEMPNPFTKSSPAPSGIDRTQLDYESTPPRSPAPLGIPVPALKIVDGKQYEQKIEWVEVASSPDAPFRDAE